MKLRKPLCPRLTFALPLLSVLAAVSAGSAPAVKKQAKAPSPAKSARVLTPLPRFVSLDTIEKLRQVRSFPGEIGPPAVLQPVLWSGRKLNTPMRNLLQNPVPEFPVSPQTRLAQAYGAPVTPAQPVIPSWVRYPLEFQLAGIGLGTRALDKDRFNRIERYGLFAMHGNPTAVVVPVVTAGAQGQGATGAGNAAGANGGAPGAAGGAAGGGETQRAAPANQIQVASLTVSQTPPSAASLFPDSPDGGLPNWAGAITVGLDNNHVEWLYNRKSYSMGFVVDRLGFVDAIVVAGISSNITRTQLEDPVHTVMLGDDLRKVLFRYGYPDTIETYDVSAQISVGQAGAGAGGAAAGGAAGAGGGAPAGAVAGGPGAGAAAAGGQGGAGAALGGPSNGAYRTFELRYEQSYNVVFTIRDNRVVRIYIFGDPDFFNEVRRKQLRETY